MENFSAKQAAAISLENEIKIESVLENIENCCQNGGRYMLIQLLPDGVIMKLISLGYSVSRVSDPFGVESSKITW